MIIKIKKFFSSYSSDFYFFSFFIIFSTITIVFINNSSTAPSKHFLELTEEDALVCSRSIDETTNSFHAYLDYVNNGMIEHWTDEDDEFMSELVKLSELFMRSNNNVEGLILVITDKDNSADNQYYFIGKHRENSSLAGYYYTQLDSPLLSPLKNRNNNWGSVRLDEDSPKKLLYLPTLWQNEKYTLHLGFTYESSFVKLDFVKDLLLYDTTGSKVITGILDGDGLYYSDKGMELYSMEESSVPIVENMLGNYPIGRPTGIFRKDVQGVNWTYAYAPLSTGHTIISSHRTDAVMDLVNASSYIMALSALFCLWLVQKNLKTNKAPFEYLSDWLMANYAQSLSKLEMNSNRAAHAIHLGLILVVIFYTMYAIVTKLGAVVVLIHVLIATAILLAFLVYRKRALSSRASNAFAIALLTVPLALHLFEGGFSGKNPGASLIWMCAGILLVLFMFGSVNARNAFKMFILFIFLDSLIEINLLGNSNYEMIFSFTSGLFFLGFCIYASVGYYMTKSHEDYEEIDNLLHRLEETQAAAIEKEKLAVLGQLIAGIAHEINTPIGAIKASGEQIERYFFENLDFIFKTTKDFTEEDFKIMSGLIQAAKSSLAEMKSTTEVRMAKRELFTYFEELNVPEHNRLVEKFTLLEICDIEFFENRQDILSNKNLPIILDVVTKFSPVITGTQTILFASKKVSKIVFALKSYAHTSESEERSSFDVITTINNVLILYNNQIKNNVNVVMNVAPNIPQIIGNPDEIGQVWSNLIHNALYAMNYTGTITIQVYAIENCLRISFSDTGEGISKENMEKIFSPFYTTKPAGEGSGLGLEISKKIIEQHDGEMWAESKLGEGTTFYVQLPLH